MHELDLELSPEVAARVDALLETIDVDPLGRALANVIYDAWERQEREQAEGAEGGTAS